MPDSGSVHGRLTGLGQSKQTIPKKKFAYQWRGDRGTYFTPIIASHEEHALSIIKELNKRPFTGWIWEVDESNKFDPPFSGQACWEVDDFGAISESRIP